MPLEEKVIEAAAKHWQRASDDVQVKDITRSRFSWSRQHQFFMAMNRDKARLLVATSGGTLRIFEAARNLPPDDACLWNIGRLNAILSAEGSVLPGGLDLTWTLRNVIFGLGGWVAGLKFLANEESAMQMWTRPDSRPGLGSVSQRLYGAVDKGVRRSLDHRFSVLQSLRRGGALDRGRGPDVGSRCYWDTGDSESHVPGSLRVGCRSAR